MEKPSTAGGKHAGLENTVKATTRDRGFKLINQTKNIEKTLDIHLEKEK